MMPRITPGVKKRLQYAGLIALFLGSAVALTLYALSENINYFYTPSEAIKAKPPVGATVRLGGMVVTGSLQRNGPALSFELSDTSPHRVKVHYQGIPPDLFREGQGTVADGHFNADGTFTATLLLAKHDENYMPPAISAAMPKGAE